MLAKRIIPCLDVKNAKVVKGIQFQNHKLVGDPVDLALKYREAGADELVFYDISASSENRSVKNEWIWEVAKCLDIPFCVAGGIRSVAEAAAILAAGADKISINSPALENPNLINEFVNQFGSQCVVIGIDSYVKEEEFLVYQYTGDPQKMRPAKRNTFDWIKEVCDRGAGEIVLNCMNQDGMRKGYDCNQLKKARSLATVPLIASGGAGSLQDFKEVFEEAAVDGALAASVFHYDKVTIPELKKFLNQNQIEVRL